MVATAQSGLLISTVDLGRQIKQAEKQRHLAGLYTREGGGLIRRAPQSPFCPVPLWLEPGFGAARFTSEPA